MANLEKCFDHLKKWEGGYCNRPASQDKGGCTNVGITIGTYRKWFGADKTCEDLKKLTPAQWAKIVRVDYWNPFRGDDIKNQSIAELILDMCYMSGTKTAIKKVQAILGTTADGIVGSKTLALLNAPDTKATFYKLWGMRHEWLTRIAYGNNLSGWLNRLNDTKYVG